MKRPSLLADMNLSPVTVNSLREEGWDILRVSSLLAANASDAEILELARRQDRVVVTQDLDFSALLALGGHARPSLVTLRLSNTDPEFQRSNVSTSERSHVDVLWALKDVSFPN